MDEKLPSSNPETEKQTDLNRDRAKKAISARPSGGTKNLSGGEKIKEPDSLERKAEIVAKNVPRIQLKEYKNVPGFKPDFIEKCEYAVASKQSVQDYNDHMDAFQKASEPLMTMFLGGEGRPTSFLKGDGSYAIWASTYDDEKRATDIIYGVKNDKEWITCSIDVAAPKNDPNHEGINKHVERKFDNGANGAYSSLKNFEPWQQEIVFCRRGKQRFTEKNAPHFVLALSNESFRKMTGDIILDQDNQVVGCNPNSDLEFMVSSEFLTEINMQLARIGGKKAKKSEYRSKLGTLKKMMLGKLSDLLGCEIGTDEFRTKYYTKVAEMRRTDKAYKDITDLSRNYKKDYEDILNKANLYI